MSQTAPHIVILLCTFNGARFLREQLGSYLEQDHRDWSLWISDDGSTDATLAILEDFRRDHGKTHDIRILQGPRQGHAAANFLHLLCHPDLPPGFVSLSDQDDIWLPGKLGRALAHLDPGEDLPVLYSAQSHYIDGAGRRCGASIPPAAAPVFATAALQNVMAGHSMVLNPAALALVRQAGIPERIAYHDWWLTLLVAAAGGRAVLDRTAVTLYRQHGRNVLGAPGGLRAGLLRARRVLGHDYGTWVRANLQALDRVAPLLAPDHALTVRRFLEDPARRGLARVHLLRRLGLYRQSRAGLAQVYGAAFLGRL